VWVVLSEAQDENLGELCGLRLLARLHPRAQSGDLSMCTDLKRPGSRSGAVRVNDMSSM